MAHVIRLSRFLKPGGLVVFTLKVPRIEEVAGPCALFREIVAMARSAGLRLFAQTHLTYNRHEFTCSWRSPQREPFHQTGHTARVGITSRERHSPKSMGRQKDGRQKDQRSCLPFF